MIEGCDFAWDNNDPMTLHTYVRIQFVYIKNQRSFFSGFLMNRFKSMAWALRHSICPLVVSKCAFPGTQSFLCTNTENNTFSAPRPWWVGIRCGKPVIFSVAFFALLVQIFFSDYDKLSTLAYLISLDGFNLLLLLITLNLSVSFLFFHILGKCSKKKSLAINESSRNYMC